MEVGDDWVDWSRWMDDWEEFMDHIDDTRDFTCIPRIRLRYRGDPLQYYDEEEFLSRYRLRKNIVREVVLPMLPPENTDRRGLPVPPIMQLLVALRYYASGNFQLVSGEFHGLAQSTMSKIVKNVTMRIAGRLSEFVRFPGSEQGMTNFKNSFFEMAHFPGVIGCVDCTHIPIQSPGGELAELYKNRKGFFSLNVQVVFGPKMEILDIDCRWPGSNHDAHIFLNSRLRKRLETNEINGILLGDNGYPQMRYLYAPVLQPATDAERRYNSSHIATRSTVERAFGIWKRRFPCLSVKMRTKLMTSAKIVLTCAILHNVAVNHGELEPSELMSLVPPENVPLQAVQSRNQQAYVERNAFIQQHFGLVS